MITLIKSKDSTSVETWDGLSPLTTRGDVLVSTAGTVKGTRRAVGGANTYLKSDGTDVAWAAIAGGGKVLQVVAANHTTAVSNTSSTFADTGLTVAITPSDSAHKILVYGTVNGCRKDGSTGVGLALGEDIGGGGYSLFQNTFEGLGGYDAGSSTNMVGSVGFGALRSPSTTSAVTYKVQVKSTLNTGTVYTNQSTCVSWIVCMEIDT